MAAHERNISEEIAEVRYCFLINSFEAKAVRLVVIADFLYDSGHHSVSKLLLTLHNCYYHTLCDVQSLQTMGVGRSTELGIEQGESTVEVLGDVSSDGVPD